MPYHLLTAFFYFSSSFSSRSKRTGALNTTHLIAFTSALPLMPYPAGIDIDSICQKARIRASRLHAVTFTLLASFVCVWGGGGHTHWTKRQPQSLLGRLSFICNVCRPGRTFMRRLLDLLIRPAPLHITSISPVRAKEMFFGGLDRG